MISSPMFLVNYNAEKLATRRPKTSVLPKAITVRTQYASFPVGFFC